MRTFAKRIGACAQQSSCRGLQWQCGLRDRRLRLGPRVPAIVGNAILYVDGQAVASVEAGNLIRRAPLPAGARVDDDLTYHAPPKPQPPVSQAALPL